MVPEIVAHRGDAEHFPENSLAAISAAWRAGFRHVEFDVQLSSDRVPFVIHDATLERTTGRTGDVRLLGAEVLDAIGDGTAVPRLSAVVALMRELDGARAFVEVKRASLAHAGLESCMRAVLEALAPVADRAVLISFDEGACRIAREAAGLAIGWVLPGGPQALQREIEALGPEFVFCDHRRLPADVPLPRNGWSWVAYEIAEAGHALALGNRGVAMVESMTPVRLARALAGATHVRA